MYISKVNNIEITVYSNNRQKCQNVDLSKTEKVIKYELLFLFHESLRIKNQHKVRATHDRTTIEVEDGQIELLNEVKIEFNLSDREVLH